MSNEMSKETNIASSTLEDMTDAAFIKAFEALNLDVAQFNHAAHVRLGWAYLNTCSMPEAIARFNGGLRAATIALGQEKKYHETISWFYMLLINERMALGKESLEPGDWYAFKAANPDLFSHKGGPVFEYYTKATITSDIARTSFVLPDVIPATKTERRPSA